MLVIGEEEVELCQPSIQYLAQSIAMSEDFMAQQERRLPRRVNRDDLIEAFKKGGFLRSYTLRMKITGKEYQQRPKPAKSTTSKIPVATPPSRSSRQRKVKIDNGLTREVDNGLFDETFESRDFDTLRTNVQPFRV